MFGIASSATSAFQTAITLSLFISSLKRVNARPAQTPWPLACQPMVCTSVERLQVTRLATMRLPITLLPTTSLPISRLKKLCLPWQPPSR
jgi:hypothetical protein